MEQGEEDEGEREILPFNRLHEVCLANIFQCHSRKYITEI